MPSDVLNIDRDVGGHAHAFLPCRYSLTRLEIIPGPQEMPAGSAAGSWIIAVFSSPLHADPEYPDQQGPSSVVVRWQLETAAQFLHSKFDEMAPKRSGSFQVKVPPEKKKKTRFHLP